MPYNSRLTICRDYLDYCGSRKRGQLQNLANKLKKNIRSLTPKDIQESGYCWAYSGCKKKREYSEAVEASKRLPETNVFPCPVCLHWHIGTQMKDVIEEHHYFEKPSGEEVKFRVYNSKGNKNKRKRGR